MNKNTINNLSTETKTEQEELKSNVPEYDLIIIGSGPAGMAAALYAARARLNILLLDGKMPGGQMSITDKIENYPGFIEPVSGQELTELMEKQIARFGIKYTWAYITNMKKIEDKFILKTDQDKIFMGKTVLLATGADPRKMNVPGELEFHGRGVSYCATCDGPFYKEKTVLVVGGGDSAVKEAIYLTRFASKVIVVHRRDTLRAEKIIAEQAKQNEKIEFYWNSRVTEIIGEGGRVTQAKVIDVNSEETQNVSIDGAFVYIGSKPNTKFLADFIKLDEKGFIVTNAEMETSVKGCYAAGDVRVKTFRQIVTAVGDGATAADSADHYVNG
jgi:thioredoxin reductase (NADPH)